jgi:penicillin-binding protein 1A
MRAIPHYIVKVTEYDGRILEQNYPAVQEAISVRTARIMTSMLREVVLHGTGVAAARLKYPVAGKTGTTNDFTDAWFIGFSPSITCGVWMGFDEKKTLGNKETGAKAALPIWMNFMATALPREKSSRDFLPIPEETTRDLAGHAVDVPPVFLRRKDSDQKTNLVQSNAAALQEGERQ